MLYLNIIETFEENALFIDIVMYKLVTVSIYIYVMPDVIFYLFTSPLKSTCVQSKMGGLVCKNYNYRAH